MINDSNVLIGMQVIANYLGVHMDTARKYQRLGMPVNTSNGKPMTTKTAIDRWVEGETKSGHTS